MPEDEEFIKISKSISFRSKLPLDSQGLRTFGKAFFFRKKQENTKKKLKERQNEIYQLESAKKRIAVKRFSVGISGLIIMTNAILGMVSLSLVDYNLEQKHYYEKGYELFLAKLPVRIIMFVLNILPFITFSIRTLNIRIVTSTFLTIFFEFLTFAYGMGVTLYIFTLNRNNQKETQYSGAFTYFVVSYMFSFIVFVLLLYDYTKTKNFRNKGSGISYQQKMWQFSIILLYTWVMVGGVIFKYLEKETFLIGVYYCLVSATSIGYGDHVPKTTLSKSIMLVWILGATVLVGLYLVNYANLLVSILESIKAKKLAKLLRDRLMLKIREDIDRINTEKMEVNKLRRKVGYKIDCNEEKTISQSKKSNTVHRIRTKPKKHRRSYTKTKDSDSDKIRYSKNVRDLETATSFEETESTEYTENEENLENIKGMKKIESNADIDNGILDTPDSYNDTYDGIDGEDSIVASTIFEDNQSVCLEYNLIKKELETLKNSSGVTTDVWVFIGVCLAIWVLLVMFFQVFEEKGFSPFRSFWFGFVSSTTIGYGDTVYKSEYALIYFCLIILFIVSIFAVFVGAVVEMTQQKLKTLIKPEANDQIEDNEIELILSKVNKLLK